MFQNQATENIAVKNEKLVGFYLIEIDLLPFAKLHGHALMTIEKYILLNHKKCCLPLNIGALDILQNIMTTSVVRE